MTKRSMKNVSPSMMIGARRMTPGQVMRSPLATVAVRRGRGWIGRPVRRAASSVKKLCVEPVSRSTTRVVAPRETRTCMESQMGIPATARSEKDRGAFLLIVPRWFLIGGRNLDTVEVEDAATDTIMATGVRLIVVEAEAETVAFRLFLRGQPLQRRPILSRSARARWWCREGKQRLRWRRWWREGTRGSPGGRWG
jgi:hypothetical protein